MFHIRVKETGKENSNKGRKRNDGWEERMREALGNKFELGSVDGVAWGIVMSMWWIISPGFDGIYSHPTFQALFYYYTDPKCSSATLTVLASGYYSAGGDSERVQGATEFDFYIQSVSITVHDESTARNLNGLKVT